MPIRRDPGPQVTTLISRAFSIINRNYFRSFPAFIFFLISPCCRGPADVRESAEEDLSYYLSFHETALSSPFLTTPPARHQEDRLVWPEFDRPKDQVGYYLGTRYCTYLGTYI
jgi:hypothetical protein